jgi:molecular chaperone DnaK
MNANNTVSSVKRYMGTTEKFTLDNKEHSPEEISAKILQKLKFDVEGYLGEEIKDAVITVPAYFNDMQRTATKNAGEIAGLNVMRIINEPTAAALAYGLDKNNGETILVFDLGGGTFDVSILEIGDGVFEVKSTSGDTKLGGDDFDNKLKDYIISNMEEAVRNEVCKDYNASARVVQEAERVKIELSSSVSSNVSLPFLVAVDGAPVHFELEITRAKFESLIEDIIDNTKKSVDKAMDDANLKISDIDQIVLVGGSTRIPMVVDKIKKWMNKEPCKSVNPDEVVAIGAAIQGSVLAGDRKDIVLLDVTPLTLSIETLGGIADPVIERNTTIPVSVSKIYSTASDNQPQVDIRVYQGERRRVEGNKMIGDFILDGILPAPRAVPQIEVTFDLDANGILSVTAKDKVTGKQQSITITGNSALSKEEIDRMINDAEKYAEEDKKKNEIIEKRNNAEQLVYRAQSLLKEQEDKLDVDLIKEIEDGIASVKDNIDTENQDVLIQSVEVLNESMMKAGKIIYEKAMQEANNNNENIEVEPEAE